MRGGCLGAFALTEPDAGSDAGAAKTTAMLDEETGEYVLNGTKCFISGGSQADVVLVFALTDPKKGLKGMSLYPGRERDSRIWRRKSRRENGYPCLRDGRTYL